MKYISRFFPLLIVVLFFPFLIKFVYVSHNQYEQIPLIIRYLDPSFLDNDWSTNLNSQFSPRLFYTIYMGIFSKITTLPVAYFINYLVYTGLLAFSIYLVTEKLFRNSSVSYLTTLIILFGEKVTLGGNDLVGRDLDPPRLAFSLTVAAITSLVYGRIFLCAILFSISLYLHPLIGIEVPGVIFLSYLIIHVKEKNKILLSRQLFQLFGTFIACSLPAVITYILTLSKENNLHIQNAFLIITRFASPFHYSLMHFPFIDIIRFSVIFLLFIYFVRTLRYILEENTISLIIVSSVIIIFLCFVGFLSTDVFPLYTLSLAQFFRLTVILYFFLAITVYGECFRYYLNSRNSPLISLKKISVFLIPFILSQTVFVFRSGLTPKLFILAAGLTAIMGLYRSNKLISLILPVLVLCTVSLPYHNYRTELWKPYPYPTSEVQIALWVKNNLPQKATFLIPPDFIRFRLVSERAAVVDRLVIPFQYSGINNWFERITDVNNLEKLLQINSASQVNQENYLELIKNRIISLRDRYGFDYLITRHDISEVLEKVYETEGYRIYDSGRKLH